MFKDLPKGESLVVEVEGKQIAIFYDEGKVYAIDDLCTHRGASLSEGAVVNKEVRCPWHGAKFSLETGKALCLPANKDLKCYQAFIEGDNIELEIS